MSNGDPQAVFVNGQVIGIEPTYLDHPIDKLEPLPCLDPEREIKVRFLGLLGNALGELQGPLEAGDARIALTRFYAIGMALGLPCVDGLTMTEAARRCDCSRASISHIAGQFRDVNGLPNSPHMKASSASANYREARVLHLEIAAMPAEQLLKYYDELDPDAQLKFLRNPDYKKRLKAAVNQQKL
jgi:hypothetical protein